MVLISIMYHLENIQFLDPPKKIPPCQDLLNSILGGWGRVEFLKQKSKQMVFGKCSRS